MDNKEKRLKQASFAFRDKVFHKQHKYIYPRPKPPPDEDNDFVPDPLAQKQAPLVEQITRLLQDKEICDHVFRELHEKQQEALRSLKFPDANKTRPLPFLPSLVQNLTREAKQKALAIIKAEINQLFGEIRANEKTATKLMSNAVFYAKRIGDHLLDVKDIVGHDCPHRTRER